MSSSLTFQENICSFCGTNKSKVRVLITGPLYNICNGSIREHFRHLMDLESDELNLGMKPRIMQKPIGEFLKERDLGTHSTVKEIIIEWISRCGK
jgi:hypothetical protein